MADVEWLMSKGTRTSTYYAAYDTISCVEDTESVGSSQRKRRTVLFFTGCVIISMIGGFTLHLLVNSKRYNKEIEHYHHTYTPPPSGKVFKVEDPKSFATRALAWATLMALAGTGTLALTAVYTWKMFSSLADKYSSTLN